MCVRPCTICFRGKRLNGCIYTSIKIKEDFYCCDNNYFALREPTDELLDDKKGYLELYYSLTMLGVTSQVHSAAYYF